MPHHHKPRHRKRHPKKRSAITRFFVVLYRIISRPFKILFRMVGGGRGWKGWLKFGAVAGVVGVVLAGLTGITVIAVFSKDLPDPNKLIDREVAQSTKIYDRTGEHLLYEISGEERRTVIQLDNLPDHVSEAVIALEDKTFYEHSGFNFERLTYAVWTYLTGQTGPGASTLTSQLVKNAILTPERTVTRKLKEMILTYRIERKFDKEQILQLYLNEIPYGSTVYGIESAANFYFDKSATELNLAESATLAAIVKAPTYFSPHGSNVDDLMARKDLTLRLMEEQGYISEKEMKEAQNYELSFQEPREDITAPHFVFYVREQLVEKYGEHMVNQGGLVVNTTLDMDKHEIAKEVMEEQREANKGYNASNASLVSMDPNTGEILTMIGSYDYFDDEIDGQVNVATRPRQPGSSFKPIVYTQGWKRGYTPSTVLFDVVTTFPGSGESYEPKNYDLNERGPISIRKALQGSLNIPAVKMLYLVGVDPVLDFAEELGYTTLGDRSRFGLSLVLGGGEVKLLEHTTAYATLAAEGEYREPLSILEVQTSDGTTLDTFEQPSTRVVDQNIARITTDVLSDNQARAYAFGLSTHLQLGGRPVAAKSGTTNDYRDAWTMGYTPNLAAGVWAGNNDFTEMSQGAGGGTVAGPIWNRFMRRALEGEPVQSFNSPRISTPEKAVLSGQGFGVKEVTIDTASEKLATEYTPESFKEKRLYIDAHSILHYVDPSNPTGPVPESPVDPQYDNWESAVQGWIQQRVEEDKPIFEELKQDDYPDDIKLEQGKPPEEEDDLHTPENQPELEITSPDNGDELDERSLNVSVDTSAPRGVSRVEYFLDDVYLGTATSAPHGLDTSLTTFPNGFYTLRAVAYDDIDNSEEHVIRIQLQSNDPYSEVEWRQPSAKGPFELGNTIPLSINIDTREGLNQVTFFADNQDTGEQDLIEAIIGPSAGTLESSWTPEAAGMYRLYAKISTEGSGVFTSPSFERVIEEPEAEEGDDGEGGGPQDE